MFPLLTPIIALLRALTSLPATFTDAVANTTWLISIADPLGKLIAAVAAMIASGNRNFAVVDRAEVVGSLLREIAAHPDAQDEDFQRKIGDGTILALLIKYGPAIYAIIAAIFHLPPLPVAPPAA